MSDLFGPPQPPFKDIRNTRPSVAEQKAELCQQIRELCRKVPPHVANGSIQAVRDYCRTRKETLAIASSTRSSVHGLAAALSNMQRVCK